MKLDQINGCVVIPTYNNSKTLRKVIEGVLEFSSADDVIVVNDGSTDDTETILESFGNRIIVAGYPQNAGKGFALRKGFEEAIKRGFDNAITIDSDGQHFPEDIALFIKTAKQNPGAVLMGSRNMEQADVPGKSSFGNKFSNFWFTFETGIRLPDTQTGFRLYPLQPLKKIRLFTRKFETEIELIVKMAWRDVPFIPIPVKVVYDMPERVSHFRPFKDFTRISILNTYFVILTLLYYLPRRLWRKVKKKGLWSLIKEEAFNAEESNSVKSASIGFGFFMGIVPIWGFQLMVGIPLAVLFRMNKVLFIAAANISIPPMIPPILFASYLVGGFFVDNPVAFSSPGELSLNTIHLHFVQYFVGAVVLAIVAGIAGYLVACRLYASLRKEKTKS